jgi:hypothetical protein
MPTPEEYRYRAEHFLKLANDATDLFAKTALLEGAAELRAAAEQLERRSPSSQNQGTADVAEMPAPPSATEQIQPVVQQQQQVQPKDDDKKE